MTWRLLLSSVSALALALLAAVCVHGVASLHQRQALGSTTALLEASARAIEGELNLRARTLAELSESLATDPDLPAELEAAGGRSDHRIKEFRGVKPDVDSLTLMNAEGVVVGTNAPRYHVGDNLVAGRRAPKDEPAAPGRSSPPKTPGLLDAVLAGYASRGVSFFDGVLYHWGSAPIRVKGGVVGAVLIERRLQALPPVSGCQAFLVVGGKVALGTAREGWRDHLGAGPDKPFLLLAMKGTAAGSDEKRPMFIDDDRIGIWARRFHVPGSAAPAGFVTVDLTSGFAELASFQRMIMTLFLFVWLAHVALLFTAGRLAPAQPKRKESSFRRRATASLRPLAASLHARIGERLPALRVRLADFLARAKAAPSPESATMVLDGPGQLEDEEEDKTPPLGERVLAAGLTASTPGAPSPSAGLPPPSGRIPTPSIGLTTEAPENADAEDATAEHGEDATSAMAMTPELMAELGYHDQAEEGAPATTVMNVTEELLAEVKAAKAAAKADAPKPDAPKADAPKPDAPEAPKADAPKADAPEAPKADAPKLDAAPVEESTYRDLYARFSTMRKICGEAGELAFETFKKDLEQSRAEVMAKHNCKEVRFHVTIQAGKAVFMTAPVP